MAAQKRERIYIIFRWSGLVFGLGVMLVFVSSFVTLGARGLTQTLGITLVVAGIVALIQSNENLRGVEITGCRSAPAAAGDPVTLELVLRNATGRERIGLSVRTGWGVKPRASAWLPVLGPHETATVQLRLPTHRRGRFPVPTLWVSSVMPVGLCFAWKVFPDRGDYLVYPAPRGVPLDAGLLGGEEYGVRQGQGSDDVSGHRPYSPGDMLARLDWRVFARTGKLLIRAFEEGGGNEVVLRWEDTRFLKNDEERLGQLSFWIAQCVLEGRSFTLLMGGAHGPLNSDNLVACYEVLAAYQSPA